ncbi:hypothetical protein HMPREF0294_2540 [Corynebacterium glucuronolyticum ATCC 51867]|nr:hypothetical protein HMPREF0294_2540 [Corynebacterium glucuronolyticum ATCC 51867]
MIPVKEFIAANPRVEVLPGLWIAGEELTELIISEKVIATVDRLISNSHSRHITDGRAAIHEIKTASQNQDDYLHRFTKLEAEYQQTLADRQQTHEQIRTKDARRATIIAVYRQLADQPIKHFQPSQWTALIDHAVVDEGEIRFVFRTGAEIIVEL